jgi:hypothetical protein
MENYTPQSKRTFDDFKSLSVNDLFVLFYDYFELEECDIPSKEEEDGGYPSLAIKTGSSTYKVIFWSKGFNRKKPQYINTQELHAQQLLVRRNSSYSIDPDEYISLRRVDESELQEFVMQAAEY